MASSMRFPPPNSTFLSDSRNETVSISDWSKRVWTSHTLPSLMIPNLTSTSQQEQRSLVSRRPIQSPTQSSQYKLSPTPPTNVRGLILRQLARLIGTYAISDVLRSLPSPVTKPLNYSLLSDDHAIEAEYNRIMNFRDLFLIQQLMIEMRLGRHLHRYTPSKHLSDVRNVVSRAEEAALYLQDFVAADGLHMDFLQLNEKRRAALLNNHPVYLIQPYLIDSSVSALNHW